MELHVGCAMWTYAPWQGRYLPGSLPPRDRLRAYATWCNAVEGNTTFDATPTLDTVKSWAEQTTPDFRFILNCRNRSPMSTASPTTRSAPSWPRSNPSGWVSWPRSNPSGWVRRPGPEGGSGPGYRPAPAGGRRVTGRFRSLLSDDSRFVRIRQARKRGVFGHTGEFCGATGLSIRTAATRPLYADMSGKYHGVPPLMVEDLRLMESFVDPPSTHKSPLNRNHPRKLAAEQQDS